MGLQDPYSFDKQVQDRIQFGKEDRIVIPEYQCISIQEREGKTRCHGEVLQ